MHPGSATPRRVLERGLREERQQERTGRSIICIIYLGIIQVDSQLARSEGYIPQVPNEGRPAVYVTPLSAWENRFTGPPMSSKLPVGSPEWEANWARENVRLVTIDNMGLPKEAILRDYLVKVSFPFDGASHGILTRKPGLPPVAAVASGYGRSRDDEARLKLIDRNLPIPQRMAMGRARFGTPLEPTAGAPYSGGNNEFPSPGEYWI